MLVRSSSQMSRPCAYINSCGCFCQYFVMQPACFMVRVSLTCAGNNLQQILLRQAAHYSPVDLNPVQRCLDGTCSPKKT
jgi:hypothetical protein